MNLLDFFHFGINAYDNNYPVNCYSSVINVV